LECGFECRASISERGFQQRLSVFVSQKVEHDDLPDARIASSKNAPERVEHCLTRMLPAPRQLVNPITRAPAPSRRDPNRLSCSIGEPAFPSRPGAARAAARNGGDERSGATRSHAQRALSREHGEDGEHRTFPEVSTVAHSAPGGGPGRRGST